MRIVSFNSDEFATGAESEQFLAYYAAPADLPLVEFANQCLLFAWQRDLGFEADFAIQHPTVQRADLTERRAIFLSQQVRPVDTSALLDAFKHFDALTLRPAISPPAQIDAAVQIGETEWNSVFIAATATTGHIAIEWSTSA